jgi:hypothetical protein
MAVTWTREELDRIGTAEELELESMRRDGTLRKPVTIWVVRVGDDLYVRAVNGPTGAWYRGAQTRHAGRIQAGGVVKEVTFLEEGASPLLGQIDAAYREKYGYQPKEYVDDCVTPKARAGTIRLEPRAASA